MDINFPLILVVLTALAFVIWLFDRLVLVPRRVQRDQALRTRFPGWQQEGSADAAGYAAAAASAEIAVAGSSSAGRTVLLKSCFTAKLTR